MTGLNLSTRTVKSCGLSLPTLGFGGAALGGLFSAVDHAASQATLSSAFDAGLTYIDTAPFYGFGRSERLVGDMLRGKGYSLSTKVGRLLRPGALPNPADMGWPDALPFHPEYDYTYDGIMRSFEDSQQRLGLDRIDILYVHDIGEVTHGANNKRHFEDLKSDGHRALEELRNSGVIKAIGLGVNEAEVCRQALNIGDWDVFLLAGRYTLLEQGPLDDLFPECEAAGTSIVIGGPYNSGILVGGNTWDYGAIPPDVRARVDALKQVSAEFDVPLPAAALQFPLGHLAVTSVIPGLRSIEELDATLNWAGATIPPEYWVALKSQGLLHENAPLPAGNPFKKD
ncbi:pyridoxal 4-dehydrogenase [Rhodobacterales bacterium 52_120_T64]|nr:pyridoxal 4-dehydrogenase [Rhodobacterales bacterium 52_120_T64]